MYRLKMRNRIAATALLSRPTQKVSDCRARWLVHEFGRRSLDVGATCRSLGRRQRESSLDGHVEWSVKQSAEFVTEQFLA